MNSKDRILSSLGHTTPDGVPIDIGSTPVTGIHASCVATLRDHYGLKKQPVKVHEPYQMLGTVDEDLKQAIGIDVEGYYGIETIFGFRIKDWKPFTMDDGLDILVPGDFNTTTDAKGDTLLFPRGDTSAPPSGRMPKDGYFFDAIVRQEEIDDDALNPADNLEEFNPVSDADLDEIQQGVEAAAATGRAVIANFGGTSFGDIALVPGVNLQHPKGIRDIAEWYMSLKARPDYVHAVFTRQCEIALENLVRIHARVGNSVDVVMICGTDFGTQTSSFCSVETFQELWFPYYKQVNDWIHENTTWKTFKHSCGSVEKFLESFIDCGFDILNPVQCSAKHMEPDHLKATFGDKLVFWGGGVDTQETLPFGTPAEVREEVLRRCEIFAPNGGFVFNPVHNIQARTPLANIVAMIDAVHEFNGRH
ncbi:MAG: methyltransferase [Hyphomicrobiales bacterium]|nr:methyltransferase [Hyphomicrobiales bacterium]